MHMADALVSPAVATTMYLASGAMTIYSIKKLEEELDTKLFIRLNKGIKLTDDGEISIGIHSNIGTFLLPNLIKNLLNCILKLN